MDTPAQCSHSISAQLEIEFAFLSSFSSIQAPNRLDDCHSHWWGRIFFSSSTDSHVSLFWKHSHRHMFHQLSGYPLAQSIWHIKLTIKYSKILQAHKLYDICGNNVITHGLYWLLGQWLNLDARFNYHCRRWNLKSNF